MSNIIDEIANESSPETQKFSRWKVDIRDQILYLLQHHSEINTQSKLARNLNKKDSEISRLLNGIHNITLETLVKISVVLGNDIIMTDLRAREKYLYARSNMSLSIQGEFNATPIYPYSYDVTTPKPGDEMNTVMAKLMSQYSGNETTHVNVPFLSYDFNNFKLPLK